MDGVNIQIKKLILPLGIVAGLLLAAVPALFFYQKYRESQAVLADPSLATKQQVDALVKKVGRLIELPANETPTVATVKDIEQLKSQSFFANAKNGDSVLIYTQAKKAILYRSSIDKVIDVAPVNIDQTEASNSAIIPSQTVPATPSSRLQPTASGSAEQQRPPTVP